MCMSQTRSTSTAAQQYSTGRPAHATWESCVSTCNALAYTIAYCAPRPTDPVPRGQLWPTGSVGDSVGETRVPVSAMLPCKQHNEAEQQSTRHGRSTCQSPRALAWHATDGALYPLHPCTMTRTSSLLCSAHSVPECAQGIRPSPQSLRPIASARARARRACVQRGRKQKGEGDARLATCWTEPPKKTPATSDKRFPAP